MQYILLYSILGALIVIATVLLGLEQGVDLIGLPIEILDTKHQRGWQK